MSEKSGLHLVGPPDPFDPEALRLDQSFANGPVVKKLLTSVPCRKPGSQDFVRVHLDESYRLSVALIVLKDDRESYLMSPALARELVGEWNLYMLYTAITRQDVLFLWPVRLPGADGRQNEWWRSAAEAAERAMTRWIRLKADMGLGAYQLFEAEGEMPDPEWPTLPFTDLLRISFRDRLVDKADHPVLKRLRGAT
jgi:hypothetical protein